MEEFRVGSRIIDETGYKGTVLFAGPIKGSKNADEVWLGIEWDEASRGKHDGTFIDPNGTSIRYFECRSGAGSFIKPSKVNFGRSLDTALQERYVPIDAPIIETSGNYVETFKGNKKAIEFVGEKWIREKQQLENLSKVSVRNDSVSKIGVISSLSEDVLELDLQDNLIWDWNEIMSLAISLPALQSLLLQGNKFSKFNPEKLFDQDSKLSNLKVLALNGCNLKSWGDIELLQNHFPVLEELYVANNDFRDLANSNSRLRTGAFTSLRVLDISFCRLNRWEQILYFGRLAYLAEVLLDGNDISESADFETDTFIELTRISLSDTRFNDWNLLNSLNSLPKLQHIRITHIPLFYGKGASEVRPLVIGRVQRLQYLNGSFISLKERQLSERIYFKTIIHDTKSDTPDCTVLKEHPRLLVLRSLFGKEHEEQTKVQNATNLSSNLILVNLHDLCGVEGKCVSKSVPKSLKVGKLKFLIKQCFGADPSLQLLSLRQYKGSIPVLLDDDESSMEYVGAVDDCDIFVNF